MYDGVLLYAPPELEAERDVQEATAAASSSKGKKLVEDMAAYLSAIGMDRSHHFMRIHNDRLRAENDQLDNEIAALKGQRKPHPSRYEVHEGLTSEDLENALHSRSVLTISVGDWMEAQILNALNGY
jgi:hypothetical protein